MTNEHSEKLYGIVESSEKTENGHEIVISNDIIEKDLEFIEKSLRTPAFHSLMIVLGNMNITFFKSEKSAMDYHDEVVRIRTIRPTCH